MGARDRNPLWDYDLLEPGRRRVTARRLAAPLPLPGLSGETIVLSSEDGPALAALAAAAFGERAPFAVPPWRAPARRDFGPAGVALLGVPMEAAGRALAATEPAPGDRAGTRLLLRPALCDGCQACVQACPAGCIAPADGKVVVDETACLECHWCTEACPRDALLPLAATPPRVMCPDVTRPAGYLATLGGSAPAQPQPPAAPRARPFYVLGLAISTMQENAAALLKDGRLVGAVEEERLSRRKHHGFRIPGRPGKTLCNDLTLRPEDALAWRSVRHLLEREGISLDDVDVFAVNGVLGRLHRSYAADGEHPMPRVLRSGKWVSVPHHLAHAASAYYFSGRPESFVLTVDGRGERETAAFFTGSGGKLERQFDVLSRIDSSIGGAYETISRILGFGSHGQGSTMALAVMGEPAYDLGPGFSLERHDRYSIHQAALHERFRKFARGPFDPLREEHRNLAASAQKALEDVVVALIEEGRAGRPVESLQLAGGVALNCQMNTRLRAQFGVKHMFVQPAAHDAGTAIGAALEAHRFVTGEAPFQPFDHAFLGPEASEREIDEAVAAFGLSARKMDDVADEVAELVAGGAVVAWHQGPLEIGPRALGGRSLLANPANPALPSRLNPAKGREPWRPFAPSILDGTQDDWFVDDARNPFMLFVASVRPDRRDRVPAIVHHDGTTRPQTVTKEAAPLYHRVISRFRDRTGIPMVLNTSFNTAEEPIVCSARDSVSSFLQLQADWLAIGDRLVRHPKDGRVGSRPALAPPPAPPPFPAPAQNQQFRRLLLRLGTRCNSGCVHCPLRDLAGLPERTTDEALKELRDARKRGCTEVVFLRGEPLVRKDILRLCVEARQLGYRHVQLQTNARMLSLPRAVPALLRAGATFFETSLYGDEAAVHDAISRSPGSFDQTVAGLRALVAADAEFLVNVPVQAANHRRLDRLVALLAGIGARRVQFVLARPVWLPAEERHDTTPVVRLGRVAPSIREGLRAADAAGLQASVEGMVLCHLDVAQWDAAEMPGEVDDMLVAELGRTTSALGVRAESRPEAAPCRECRVHKRCAKPWGGFVQLWGDGELEPLR